MGLMDGVPSSFTTGSSSPRFCRGSVRPASRDFSSDSSGNADDMPLGMEGRVTSSTLQVFLEDCRKDGGVDANNALLGNDARGSKQTFYKCSWKIKE